MTRLHSISLAIAVAALAILGGGAGDPPATSQGAPQYDAQGRLILPTDYRSWIFLSSGLDMSYSETQPQDGQHMFNNVFVPHAAYDAFNKTGTWPDKTVLLLENRGGITNRSILKHGQVQTEELMGLEAHVKDTARFKGGWAFFGFGSKKPAERISDSAGCSACHQAHGAVDTTFVQFYPTLLPVAAKLKTLSSSYLADMKASAGK